MAQKRRSGEVCAPEELVSRSAFMAREAAVPTPDDFVIPLETVTRDGVKVVWNGSSATDDHNHKVYYYDEREKVVEVSGHEVVIEGLSPGKRYSFSSSNVKDGEESGRSEEVIIDTLPDSSPPNVPAGLSVNHWGGALEVSFRNNNRNMADFKGHKIYYGVSPSSYSHIDTTSSVSLISRTISIQKDTTYYIAVSAYDAPRPESNESEKTPVFVYTPESSDDEGEDGGCFIATAAFGSRAHPAVKVFREFRDKILLDYQWGKRLVKYYYQRSPEVSKIIQDSSVLKILVSILLSPALLFCFLALNIGFLWTSSLSVFLISLMGCKWILPKK